MFSDLAEIIYSSHCCNQSSSHCLKAYCARALRETPHNHPRWRLLPVLQCRSWNLHKNKVMLEHVQESELKAKCNTKASTHPAPRHHFLSSKSVTCQAWNAHVHTHNPRMAEHWSGLTSVLSELQVITANEPLSLNLVWKPLHYDDSKSISLKTYMVPWVFKTFIFIHSVVHWGESLGSIPAFWLEQGPKGSIVNVLETDWPW